MEHGVEIALAEFAADVVDGGDELGVREADVIGSDADDGTVAFVQVEVVVHLEACGAAPDSI